MKNEGGDEVWKLDDSKLDDWKKAFTSKSGIQIKNMSLFLDSYVLLELFNVTSGEINSVQKKIKGMTFNVLRKPRAREEALPPQQRLQPGHAGEMSDEQYEANVQRALVDSANPLPIRHDGSRATLIDGNKMV